MTGRSAESVAASVSAAEYEGWRQYRMRHPPESTDLLLANLSAVVHSYMTGGKSKEGPVTFAPWLTHLLETPEQQRLDRRATAMQGVVSGADQTNEMALHWARKRAGV